MLAHDEEVGKEYLRCKDLAAEDVRQTLLPGSQALILTHHPAKCRVCFDTPYIVLRMMGARNTAVELMAKDGTVLVAPIINLKPYHGQEDISNLPTKSPRVITDGISLDNNISTYLDSEDESITQLSTS